MTDVVITSGVRTAIEGGVQQAARALTVNPLCGSGLRAIVSAWQATMCIGGGQGIALAIERLR